MEKGPCDPKNDGHLLDENVDRCSNDLHFNFNPGLSPTVSLLISVVSFPFISNIVSSDFHTLKGFHLMYQPRVC